MKERIKLILFISLLFLLTSIHSVTFYAVTSSVLIILDIKFFLKTIKKVLLSFLFFNLIITLSYAIYTYILRQVDYDYIILINLRVFSLSYLTFYFVAHTNIFISLSFSQNLSRLFIITYSQIINFIKTYTDLKFANRSRTINSPKKNLYLLAGSAINLFFTKSIYNAKETSLAMRSRGLVDG